MGADHQRGFVGSIFGHGILLGVFSMLSPGVQAG
ncbi:hypothetical protein EHW99_1637 [Erwinia amylovora]|uniref:Uncharacterized protein n=3 Tax=Erwinia amylovora TaxID=552 RepID=A0A830ZW72_ERWAM|nr:hypothetical protein EaACW_1959 [Erwinia amylovora ACW56400]QJQ54341.1 hypothetical protein EHX00_1637 [Erwinia amylovora]CBA20898.1 hypothetical protein predicted by Glimmer/Critica [Erwinia amylovora CFBP1430]CBX80823.1 hypothetical protein predicted by Glimmer/Critica [Erwinia amylovora ATCC BAA-2158]CCO78806.1 hypothetical protein BN432_2008 [Erwinia amylovora Ea356]CCO82604.1 hypothetical protein BN433_2034 [Erwinia amylovora Ea266]CCO86385.1 hypothetical protein BN434_1997 [Erwinia a